MGRLLDRGPKPGRYDPTRPQLNRRHRRDTLRSNSEPIGQGWQPNCLLLTHGWPDDAGTGSGLGSQHGRRPWRTWQPAAKAASNTYTDDAIRHRRGVEGPEPRSFPCPNQPPARRKDKEMTTTKARHPGMCSWCGMRVFRRQEIALLPGTSRWVHVDCYERVEHD